MGSIVTNISNVVSLENYSTSDASLLSSKDFVRSFGQATDYIEFHLYSPDGTLLLSDYNFRDYKVPGTLNSTSSLSSNLIFSPDTDIQSRGYVNGVFNVQYNILRNRINTFATASFFISEISNDRTELRLVSNNISNVDLENATISFISDIQSVPYYKDFLLDFGSNKFEIGVNISLDKNTTPYSILVKLYQPLDNSLSLNSTLWIVEEISDPYSFKVELFPDPVVEVIPMLRGPNFDLDIDHLQIPPSRYYNYNQLLGNNSLSSYQQLINMMNSSGITLNIDYSDFTNFVHFSSAKQRLLNFYSKVQSLENYSMQIGNLSSLSSSIAISNSISLVQNNVNFIIQKFDGYDSFLYNSSSSLSWPKSNSELPYTLFPSTSSQVQSWLGSDDSFNTFYGGQILSASLYDSQNLNDLIHSIPEFILLDPNNDSYALFVEMIGQHFDSIWTYIKAAGDIYKANNSFDKGISKDLVYYSLRSMGMKLYNDNSNQDLYSYLLGRTVSGSYLPATSSFNTLIIAASQSISGQDQVKELFKRIYHNVPFILKTKGTDRGLRALSNLYGVPSTIMKFNEYGGMDKEYGTSQYSFDRFSYALQLSQSSAVTISWDQLNLNAFSGLPSSFADTIEFRFKPNADGFIQNPSQSLFDIQSSGNLFGATLTYSSSNGIPYGNIDLFISNGSGSNAHAGITLPIFYTGSTGDIPWWNVMIRRRNPSFSLENDLIDFDIQFVIDSDTSLINVGAFDASGSGDQYYDIFVKNEINGSIGHQASASIFVSQSLSASFNQSWDTSGEFTIGFDSLVQEVRFWNIPLKQSSFNYHVLNPESIEGVDSGSFYNNLAGRFTLGNDLFTYNHALTSSVSSIHPNQKAVFPSASFIGFDDENNYVSNIEIYYSNVPVVGYSSPVTDKIRIQDITITGSVLTPYIRLEQPLQFPLTKDLHFINASFSPQDEINEDMIASLGSTFIIDNYIGNPDDDTKSEYKDLNELKSFYYQKYFAKYDYKDYINLIHYFNNSLFKMFGDFVAGRTNLQTGITIKPTILDRSKVKRYSPVFEQINNFTASVGGHHLVNDTTYHSNYGDGRDFLTGELSGSIVDVDKYFTQGNENPYAIFGNHNLPTFKNGEFDVLMNNVSQNITSSIRKKIDDNGKLLIDTYLQDYYYDYTRHILPRYLGSKSTSKVLTFYTSQSYSGSTLIWDGDSSYGKNASIDLNTTKFGWVKEIAEKPLNFFDKTSVILKYLVDSSGSMTELSRHNFNLFEVQNIFRSGTPTIVSLSDLINPSNQTTLDGNKNIFEGGFSYWPIVYRESAEQLHFRYLTSISSTQSISLTATQTKLFQFNSKNIALPSPNKDIDSDTSDGDYTLTYGSSILSTGQFALAHVFPFTSWSYASVPGLQEISAVTFPSGAGAGPFTPGLPFTTGILPDIEQFVYPINNNFFNLSDLTSSNDSFTQYVQLSDGSYAIKIPRTSTYNFNVNIPFNFSIQETGTGGTILKTIAVLEKNSGSNAQGQWQYLASSTFNHVEAATFAQYCWNNDKSLIFLDFDSWQGGSTDFPIKVLCNINNNINLNANDYVRLNFFIIRLRNFFPSNGVDHGRLSFANRFSNFSSSIQAGSMTVTDTINDTVVLTTDGFYTDNTVFSLSGSLGNVLQFTDSASLLYGNVIFDEAAISSSTALLYSPIDFPFIFEVGDVVRLTSYFTSNPTYYRVNQVIPPVISGDGVTVLSDLKLVLDKPVIITGGISSNFVIFRRLPDETSVILNFNKSPGSTSQALLVPIDIDLNIKSDIANIVTEISPGIQAL